MKNINKFLLLLIILLSVLCVLLWNRLNAKLKSKNSIPHEYFVDQNGEDFFVLQSQGASDTIPLIELEKSYNDIGFTLFKIEEEIVDFIPVKHSSVKNRIGSWKSVYGHELGQGVVVDLADIIGRIKRSRLIDASMKMEDFGLYIQYSLMDDESYNDKILNVLKLRDADLYRRLIANGMSDDQIKMNYINKKLNLVATLLYDNKVLKDKEGGLLMYNMGRPCPPKCYPPIN